MANKADDFDLTGTLNGVVSARPRELKLERNEQKIDGLTFEVTTERRGRVNSTGDDYNVDPRYSMRVYNFEDDEDASRIFKQVGDLRIGDQISVEIGVVSSSRRGRDDLSLRVLSINNGGGL